MLNNLSIKEEAQVILDSFIQLNYQHSVDTEEEHGMSHEYHKKCAILHVDGIIKALEKYDERNNTHELQNMDSSFRYWEKVRKEIELL